MDHDRDFGVLLGLAFQELVRELHGNLDEAGFGRLKESFGFAVKALAEEALTTSQLAARLKVTHQGAAKTVDEMVAAGLVERVPDSKDGRMKRLVLTERARALMAAGHEFHQAYEQDLVDEVGAEDVAATRRVLNAIVQRPSWSASLRKRA